MKSEIELLSEPIKIYGKRLTVIMEDEKGETHNQTFNVDNDFCVVRSAKLEKIYECKNIVSEL